MVYHPLDDELISRLEGEGDLTKLAKISASFGKDLHEWYKEIISLQYITRFSSCVKLILAVCRQ